MKPQQEEKPFSVIQNVILSYFYCIFISEFEKKSKNQCCSPLLFGLILVHVCNGFSLFGLFWPNLHLMPLFIFSAYEFVIYWQNKMWLSEDVKEQDRCSCLPRHYSHVQKVKKPIGSWHLWASISVVHLLQVKISLKRLGLFEVT